MAIKYSIVIPTLNGFDGLRVILPYILSIDRDDFEVVVSDNCSDDSVWEYLCSLNDDRLSIFKTSERMPHSEHLNFAYSKSRGLWIGHIGDDDLILKDRFELLDEITETSDLIVGESLRYVWHGHNIEPENSICTSELRRYSHSVTLLDGIDYYKDIINYVGVPGGGQWLVSREVYQSVVDAFGYFCPSAANVEFFALRASAFFSKKVARIDYPLFINGRMKKSSGGVLVSNGKELFDWGFENPGGVWEFCPVPTHAYYTISLDAALRVENVIRSGFFSKLFWGRICMGALLNNSYGADSSNRRPSVTDLYKAVIFNYPYGSVYAFLRWLVKRMLVKLYIFSDRDRHDFVNIIGNKYYIKGELLGIKNIADFADWYIQAEERSI